MYVKYGDKQDFKNTYKNVQNVCIAEFQYVESGLKIKGLTLFFYIFFFFIFFASTKNNNKNKVIF